MLCLAPVLRQIWCKKEIFEKITIDNQQVTDGGRVLLNPASATHNDIASCKATSYVVFLFYAATNLRQRFSGSYNIVVFLTICISYANNCFTL